MESLQDISEKKCSQTYLRDNVLDLEKLRKIQEKIIGRMDLSLEYSEDEIKEQIDQEILRESRREYLDLQDRTYLRKEIYYAIREYGILQDLLEDDEITEIMVNGLEPIFVEKSGRIKRLEIHFDTREKLLHTIQQIAASCNRVINEAMPIMDARLENGARVNALLPPIALNGPILTIRRFPKDPITMEDLILFGSINREVADFLKKLVRSGYNILVSGGTGSGKTTFLNALSAYIPGDERIVTIEDSAELQIQNHQNLVRLETRNANVEGCKEIPIRDLIKASLRLRPDRIIVGEVRGQEAVDMLQSLNVGHFGMTTVHANGLRDVVSRLETLVLMGMELPLTAIKRQILSGFDLMIHLGRLRDGSRKVLEIAEPICVSDGEIEMNVLYQFEEVSEQDGKVVGTLEKRGEIVHEEKLLRAGVSKEIS